MNKISNQYLLYMIFASISIIINLVVQLVIREIMQNFFQSFSSNYISLGRTIFEYWFITALMFGTLTGFVFKFVVDKFIVFQDKIISHSKDEIQKTTKQLGLYLGFAILTTAIFWGFELVFKILFSGDWYLIGGLVGLIIGYTLKFLFDRKYVFKKK